MSLEQEAIQQNRLPEETDTRSKMTDEALFGAQGCCTQKPFNFDKESSRIANKLNSDGSLTSISNAAHELSKDLRQLDGQDYNNFLKQVQEKNTNAADGMGRLLLNDWNVNTGTWDNVTITNGNCPVSDDARIVQPGNTLWRIAKDHLSRSGQSVSQGEVKQMVEAIADESHIFNPSKIDVGQVIDFPVLSMNDYSREYLPTGDALVTLPTIENLANKELIMPSGEYLSIGSGLRYPGVSWSLHAADGTTIADSGRPDQPSRPGAVVLSDGALLYTQADKWTIAYPGIDQVVNVTRNYDPSGHFTKSLDFSIQRGKQNSIFEVKDTQR